MITFSPRWFVLGVAFGWLVLRWTLIGPSDDNSPLHVRPAHTTLPQSRASQLAPTATLQALRLAHGPQAECVGRVVGSERTVPDDIVLAIMTTHKRHGLIETLRESWLRDAKALLLTDAPGLAETAKQKVVVWRGHPDCGAADRGGPTIHFANTSFWGDYKWVLHVGERDTPPYLSRPPLSGPSVTHTPVPDQHLR